MAISDINQYKSMATSNQPMAKSTAKSNTKSFMDNTTLGKEAFLKLLITQMQNQDPTQPLQDRELIAQLTQFSTLEQMTNLNDMFSVFVSAFVETQYVGGLSTMIGKKITWTEHVEGTDENGEKVMNKVPKEGIVAAVSFKNGKVQLVMQDGTKMDMSLIESITDPSAPPIEKPEEKPGQTEDGKQPEEDGGKTPPADDSKGEGTERMNEGGGA